MLSTGLAVVVAVAVIVLLVPRASIKIAREYQRYVVFRRSLGASPASKFIFPMEFTRLLEPVFNHKSGA